MRTIAYRGRAFKLAHFARGRDELSVWFILGAAVVGFILNAVGLVGQAIALLGLGALVLHIFNLILKKRCASYRFALLLGFIFNSEMFIRDFVMRALPAGYFAEEYLIILLGCAMFPILMSHYRRAVISGPAVLLLLICIWDLIGLSYSQDVWRGRIMLSLHVAGLFAFPMAAALFVNERTRWGLLDGLILGAVLSLGVMVRQSMGSGQLEEEGQFRFGHALASAVQVAIVLTVAIFACLMKLVHGYGRPRTNFICLALLSPFCIATFSRGPIIALIIATIVLCFQKAKTAGWWKLPVATMVVACGVVFVMWVMPTSFNVRYMELKGHEERGRIWRVAWRMFKDEPVLGHGSGSWSVVYPRYASAVERAPDEISDAHNFILQAASEGGAIGVAIFVAFTASLFFWAVLSRSVLGFALFSFTFLDASMANFKITVLFVILGAGFGACLSKRKAGRTLSAASSVHVGLARANLPMLRRGRFIPAHARLQHSQRFKRLCR